MTDSWKIYEQMIMLEDVCLRIIVIMAVSCVALDAVAPCSSKKRCLYQTSTLHLCLPLWSCFELRPYCQEQGGLQGLTSQPDEISWLHSLPLPC